VILGGGRIFDEPVSGTPRDGDVVCEFIPEYSYKICY
jgi:hypothetical protein